MIFVENSNSVCSNRMTMKEEENFLYGQSTPYFEKYVVNFLVYVIGSSKTE